MAESNRIFFGSLAKQSETLREQQNVSASAAAGTPAPASSAAFEALPLSDNMVESHARQAVLLQRFEQQKRARTIAVPTNDAMVKARLRELGEPIILFGEQPPERRERLREVMVRLGVEEARPTTEEPTPMAAEPPQKKQKLKDEIFYTEGSIELKRARRWIATYSLQRANARVEAAKQKIREVSFEEDFIGFTALKDRLKKYTNNLSQVGDERPLSSCTFSPDSSLLVTSSWGGVCKVWNSQNWELVATYTGHAERVGAVEWHPKACISQERTSLNFASCSADKTIRFWSLESNTTPLATLNGHSDRINRIAFHPSGRFLGSTSFDKTWRLWDVEAQKELVAQTGHSRGVYGISFQVDGSLAATSGMDTFGRVWDLRTGRSVMVLRGHAKQTLGIDFSPNGYQLITGSEDHTCRVWDLRKKKCSYIIPAHSSTVSHIKFQPNDGQFFVTASFDKTCRVWSARDWSPIATLSGHEGKVFGVDISHDSKYIVSAAADRTWKVFEYSPF
ncbi:U4/U6 small nuclear ribonucleoprotein Prp4 [Balamuthia mandrillaris]